MKILEILSSELKISLIVMVGSMIALFGYYWVFVDFFKGDNPLGFNGEWGRRIQEGEKAKVYQEIFRFVIIMAPLTFGLTYFVLETGLLERSH
ncbi:hypothetical protein KKF84_20030 [Myxococcota bacterium]|nr:hypothetical protein [Myxococcota bacterium]MBU1537614.1 hypothetical protein [Myxococcota bacterium]